jgi:CHAT domain-containing protein/tetratricopeptide (TPR) repeat protein
MTGLVASESLASSPANDDFARFLDLVTQARGLQQSGSHEQALALATNAEALAARLDPPSSQAAAQTFNSLGIVFFEAAFSRSALSLYERALAIAAHLEPKDDDLLASLHNNLGQAHQRLGQLAMAQTHLETAVAIREQSGPAGKSLGFMLDNLANVIGTGGELDRAESMHRQALAIFERLGGPIDVDVATSLGNLSVIHRKRRDFVRAEACRLRALDTHERLTGLASGGTLLDITQLADLYRDMGDDARADALMNLLLSIGGEKPPRSHRVLAEMLRTLAASAFEDFRLDLAERLGTRAAALLEAIEGPHAPETLAMLHLLGNVHRAGGHRDAAEQAYHRARSGYEALGKRDETIAVMLDLGKVYRDAGAYPLAEQVFRGVVEHRRDAPDGDRQRIASALGNLALVHYEAERYREADATVGAALAALEGDPNPYGERPWLLHNRAMLKYHLGEYDVASELYAEAKRLWTDERGEDDPFVATAASNLGLVHWARGDPDQALASLAEAEALRDRELQRVLAVGSETKRAAYAQHLQSDLHLVVSFCLALAAPRADVARFAAQMLFRRKGRVLDAIAHTLLHVRDSVRPEDRQLVARLQEVRREIAAVIAPALVTGRPTAAKERLAALRGEEERLEAELSYRGALHRPGLESITLEEIQQGLPPDGALLELLRYSVFDPTRTGKKGPWKEERYAAAVLRPAGEPAWFDLGPADAIDSQVDEWRGLLPDHFADADERQAVGGELYRLLIAPLAAAIGGARHLFVSPDGKLALIPFGLLGDAQAPRLLDRFVVSYLASGRELARAEDDLPDATGVVVIAAPDFEAETPRDDAPVAGHFADRHGFAPLPGTKDEADDLARLVPGATLITGPDATVHALRNVHRPIALHVATHGIFAPIDDAEVTRHLDVLNVGDGLLAVHGASKARLANPMFFSGLVLAGANRQGTGILTAQEIAGLDLRGTALAVLSACETGLGTVKRGEEFTGLRRALAIAGAATQVTSLWKVDDTATRFLMGHYYRLLLEGRGRAEALQLAQARIAADPEHPEWEHPVYWAAFVAAGAWGPVADRMNVRSTAAEDQA